MPLEVSVTTDPLIVYAVVALLLGSVVAALVFARPRRGLGAAMRSDARIAPGGELPWMPGGDILGRPEQPLPPPAEIAVAPAEPVAVPSDLSAPPAAVPLEVDPPPAQDARSTGSTSPNSPWGKR